MIMLKNKFQNIFKLLKKEMYTFLYLYLSLFLLGMGLTGYTLIRSGESGIAAILNLFVVWFSIGLLASISFPQQTLQIEEKNNAFKFIKCLPINNGQIFFSKWLGNIWSILVLFVVPYTILSLIYILLNGFSLPASSLTSLLILLVAAFFILMFISTLFFTILINFSYLVLIIIFQVAGFSLIFIIIKFKALTGYSIEEFFNKMVNPFILKILLISCPLILLAILYFGFKLFDKKMSYRKFQ